MAADDGAQRGDARRNQVPLKVGARAVEASVVRNRPGSGRRRMFTVTIPADAFERGRPVAAPVLPERPAAASRPAPESRPAPASASGAESSPMVAPVPQRPTDVPQSRTLFADLAEFSGPIPTGRPPVKTEAEPPHRRRWPMVVAGSAFLLSVAVPVAIRAASSSSGNHGGNLASSTGANGIKTPAPAPKSSAPAVSAEQRAELIAWVGQNLAHDAVLVGDQETVSQLRAAGFGSAKSYAEISGVPVQTIDYVLDVPATSPASTAATQLLATSLPIAKFGTGTGAATAREFFPGGTADAIRREQSDAQLRRSGGEQLGQNSAIVADAGTAAVLRAGQLDLRAQSVLNLLAVSGTIYLSDATAIAAEQRAGLPVRSVLITTDDLPGAQASLATMTAPYKPDTIVTVSPRKMRLTWQPAIAPVAIVGQ